LIGHWTSNMRQWRSHYKDSALKDKANKLFKSF
jgi:hypothetical protein